MLRLKTKDSHFRRETVSKYMNVSELVEVTERNKEVPSFPLLPRESALPDEENPKRKKNKVNPLY